MKQLRFGFSRKLPVYLQSERAECGLACLAMIATKLGNELEVADLRRQFSSSQKGTTASELIELGTHIGLVCRPLKLDVDELRLLALPAILHWDMQHYVVLSEVKQKSSGDRYIVHDPAKGRLDLSEKQISASFTGVALEVARAQTFKPQKPPRPLGIADFTSAFKGFKLNLFYLLVIGVVLEALALLPPLGSQYVIDEAVVSRNTDLITLIALGLGLLVVTQMLLNAFRSWATTVLSTKVGMHLVTSVFSHLTSLKLDYFEKRSVGDIVTRFDSVTALQRLLATGFIEAALDAILVIGTFAMMCLYSMKFAGIALVACVFYLGIRILLFKSLFRFSDEQLAYASKREATFLETIRAIQSIKIYGKRSDRISSWHNAAVDEQNANLHLSRLTLSFKSANTLLFGIDNLVFIALAANDIIAGVFSVGMFFALSSYKGQFSSRIASLIDKYFEFRTLRVHLRRIGEIVNEPPEASMANMPMPANLHATIDIQNVSFRYSRTDPFVFRNINLSLKQGESVGLIGPSGCGKSTLIKLLIGVLEPTEGEVLIGGIPLRQIRDEALGTFMTVVMQGDSLLSGSVLENISFFDRAVDFEQAMKCAIIAGIHDDIIAMPMGYQTLLGDMGSVLSGGQKQRVLLARALYPNPKILILDEATASIDILTERHINEHLSKLGVTRIVISHRKETVMTTDRQVKFAELMGIRKTVFKDRTALTDEKE
jgi:ATP-binding cassette, subfamily B, bacterial CvaB/MchF/RaxB